MSFDQSSRDLLSSAFLNWKLRWNTYNDLNIVLQSNFYEKCLALIREHTSGIELSPAFGSSARIFDASLSLAQSELGPPKHAYLAKPLLYCFNAF